MIEILNLIWVLIPMPVWTILFAGLIGYIILEVKERNDKNGEKIKGKETL